MDQNNFGHTFLFQVVAFNWSLTNRWLEPLKKHCESRNLFNWEGCTCHATWLRKHSSYSNQRTMHGNESLLSMTPLFDDLEMKLFIVTKILFAFRSSFSIHWHHWHYCLQGCTDQNLLLGESLTGISALQKGGKFRNERTKLVNNWQAQQWCL